MAGNTKDVCMAEASGRETVAKAERDAAYAVAKEKCDSLADEAQANCIREAKAHHGQS